MFLNIIKLVSEIKLTQGSRKKIKVLLVMAGQLRPNPPPLELNGR